MRKVDVWISIEAHHGTQFVLDGKAFRIREDLNGPIFVRSARDVGLIFRVGKDGEFRPLAEVCDPDLRTAA